MTRYSALLLTILMTCAACADDASSPGDVVQDAATPDAGAGDTAIPEDVQEDVRTDAAPDTGVDAALDTEDAPEADAPPEDTSEDDTESFPLEIVPSPAEEVYLDYFLAQNHGRDFVASIRWLPHFIHEQGELSICVRLEMREPATVTGEDVETIRARIEESIYQWQRGLIGYTNWTRNERTPVVLFGLGTTPAVTLEGAPDVPVYVNETAQCPDTCSRFVHRGEAMPDYADCPHPERTHFDFNIWYSDFDFGAAGHGGDWGTRLAWNVFWDEINSEGPYRVTDHELGHVAGLPDVYLYPFSLEGQQRPFAIMATRSTIQPFDHLMLRAVWDIAYETWYQP